MLTIAVMLSCLAIPANLVYAQAPETTVSLLGISDAIAPINGEAPVAAILETDQYRGEVVWEGNPGEFEADKAYTATITLAAKEGYTFGGVAENAFRVSCAMSATNDPDSGVITATFVSPPEGFITDGHGVMAYTYKDGGTFDIKGFFFDGWKGTTSSDAGYGTRCKIGDESGTIYVPAIGEPVPVVPKSGEDLGLTMDIDFVFMKNGEALQVEYTLDNSGDGSTTVSFGSWADIMIGSDDWASVFVFDESLPVSVNRGFKMVSNEDDDRNGSADYAQFNFFGKRSVGVTDVDTFWYGGSNTFDYEDPDNGDYDFLFTQVEDHFYEGDSAIAYSWQDEVIGPQETKIYSVVIGISEIESPEVPTYTVSYDDNVPDAMIPVPETQQKTENVDLEISKATPVRSGYNFQTWNTEPNGSGESYYPGDLYTSNAKLVLYAQWRKSESPSPPPPEIIGGNVSYAITATAGKGGEISPSGKLIVNERQDKAFTITPNAGYVISDVLVDGESVGSPTGYVFRSVTRGHTIEAVFAARRDNPFEDVKERDWFFDSVLYAHHRGLLLGTSDTTFEPHTITTRAMIPTILYRMEGSPDVSENPGFSDVGPGLWYTDGIWWSAENQIVLGLENGTFAPDAQITREQLAVMLYRYAGYKRWDVSGSEDLSVFSDGEEVSQWALEAIRWAVGSSLMRGKGDGVLDPKGPALRSEVATILMNLIELYGAGS